ncbi:alpha/beta fold hydrolase [Allonocardiopsis opalescens]|uniref:Alpha/beta hydrolase family protein n=1 Tax=Allonocardiopsis opalescens TaxID=1144618 RepID=A0A2T0Q241_9ACTN|nr:alpha/beta fold hydrolase [Allonocardiopsis opalescens]PRX97863.1 alpha/beta hydrolase family protein [Allonocardiopsis opalescens]
MATRAPLTVVLVHGNFLGPWSWEPVAAILAGRGMRAVSVPLPSSTASAAGPGGDLHDDAAAVRAAVAGQDGPVVLCGHSYGGAVVTEAAAEADGAVAHLVYLAGAVPDAGESMADLARAASPPAAGGGEAGESVRVRGDGMIELLPDSARHRLFHDCDEERTRAALDRLVPSNPVVGTQPLRGAG